MDKEKLLPDICKLLGLSLGNIAKHLAEIVKSRIEDEKTDRKAFEERIKNCSDEEMKRYIPDVYQKDIYKIDYAKLWDNGIRLISYDIDDTINDVLINKVEDKVPVLKVKMPNDAKELFEKLKFMGFTVTLLTNAGSSLAKETCEQLKADGYIARANKPETMNFKVMQEQYGVEKSQMAHVGNDILKDVGGGNDFGIVTCLVRRKGFAMKIAKFVGNRINMPTKGNLVREELLKRNLWRKHHLKEKKDQYYQLNETPAYRR